LLVDGEPSEISTEELPSMDVFAAKLEPSAGFAAFQESCKPLMVPAT